MTTPILRRLQRASVAVLALGACRTPDPVVVPGEDPIADVVWLDRAPDRPPVGQVRVGTNLFDDDPRWVGLNGYWPVQAPRPLAWALPLETCTRVTEPFRAVALREDIDALTITIARAPFVLTRDAHAPGVLVGDLTDYPDQGTQIAIPDTPLAVGAPAAPAFEDSAPWMTDLITSGGPVAISWIASLARTVPIRESS